MKHFITLFFFFPLLTFSQNLEELSLKYEPDTVIKHKIESISFRRTQIRGDSVISDMVLEQIFFGKNGKAQRQIFWNERDKNSVIIEAGFEDQTTKAVFKPKNPCNYDLQPALKKLQEVTGAKCLPREFEMLTGIEMHKTVDNDEIMEFIFVADSSSQNANYFLGSPFFTHGYPYVQSSDSENSLDPRIFIRINHKEKRIELQITGIYNPPTDVPQTGYQRTVYHYDFSMRLLWKDEYGANLGYYDFGEDRSEYKIYQTIYDYYEYGWLKRELTIFENHPYGFDQKGVYMTQTSYEITNW